MQHDAKHLRFLRASLCARIFWIVGEALRFLSPLPLSPVLPVSLWLRKKSFWARWCPSSLFQLRSVCIYTESHWHHMWCCTSCTNFTDVCHWTPTPTRTQTDKSSLMRTATSWSICSALPVVSPNLLHYHAWIFITPKQQSCWFSNLLWGKKKKVWSGHKVTFIAQFLVNFGKNNQCDRFCICIIMLTFIYSNFGKVSGQCFLIFSLAQHIFSVRGIQYVGPLWSLLCFIYTMVPQD